MTPTKLHSCKCSVCSNHIGYTLHESSDQMICDACVFAVQLYFREEGNWEDNPFLRIYTTGRTGVEPDGTIWLDTKLGGMSRTAIDSIKIK